MTHAALPTTASIALLLCLAVPASAIDLTKLPKPQGYVSDLANVVDPASEAELERLGATLQRSTGAQFALVTLPSIDNEPIEDVANALYRQWGIGSKETNEGVLVLLVTQEHRSRIEVGYGLEPTLPDSYVVTVLQQVRPLLRENNYGAALVSITQNLGERIADAKNVTLSPDVARRAPPPPAGDGLPWPVILFGLFFLFTLFRGSRRRAYHHPYGYSPGVFIPPIIFGPTFGGRHSGGGGFGNYDGGGGFGGFGGGDSGGGGASSDW